MLFVWFGLVAIVITGYVVLDGLMPEHIRVIETLRRLNRVHQAL